MSDEKFTLFWGGPPFSQWCRSPFTIDNVDYTCAEQWMMASKAVLFEDEVNLELIMEADHPREQKRLGRQVQGFDSDQWNAVARDIVYKGNYAKFSQNLDLKEQLLATVGTTLVEASPYDAVWGIALSDGNSDCHDRSKWRGTNWLGEVLTQLREDMIAGIERKEPEEFCWS